MGRTMFSIGDNVTVVPNIEAVEVSAGRDTCKECMSIGDKVWTHGLNGVVIEIDEDREYGQFLRTIYRVDFADIHLPYCGTCWLHEKWLDPTYEALDEAVKIVDEMLAEF